MIIRSGALSSRASHTAVPSIRPSTGITEASSTNNMQVGIRNGIGACFMHVWPAHKNVYHAASRRGNDVARALPLPPKLCPSTIATIPDLCFW